MKTIGKYCLFGLLFLASCSKDVKVDIPDFEARLVVDGFIETGMPPVVILTQSQDIFSSANVGSLLSSFITDAQVSVHNGENEYPLQLVCSSGLPLDIQQIIGSMLGIHPDTISSFNLCAYTSFDLAAWGEVGKTYRLKIEHQGNTYTSSAPILPPYSPSNITIWWEEEKGNPNFGFSHATLQDPANEYNAYKWEVKRMRTIEDSLVLDPYFRMPFSGAFDDNFFNGKTFTFLYENPWTRWDSNFPNNERGRYKLGDTVIIKLSRMNQATHDFLFSKQNQALSTGNPFASAMNVKTNISEGALGLWAAYSPMFDTLICQ